MHKPSLYSALCAIVGAEATLLTAYESDLHEIDRGILAESLAGDQFVWIGRDHGTNMARVGSSNIEQEMARHVARSHPDHIYLLTVEADGGQGAVKHIDLDGAQALLDGRRAVVCREIYDDQALLIADNTCIAKVRLISNKDKPGVLRASVAMRVEGPSLDARLERNIRDAVVEYGARRHGSLFVRFEAIDIHGTRETEAA